MSGDFIYILSVLAAVAFSSFTMYGSEDNRAAKFALGAILLAALSAPVMGAVKNLAEFEIPEYGESDYSSELTEDVAKEAYCRGIRLALKDKFSLDYDAVEVDCIGFDLESMTAERINIILSDSASYSDSRGIRLYISENFGECEVSFDFGKDEQVN